MTIKAKNGSVEVIHFVSACVHFVLWNHWKYWKQQYRNTQVEKHIITFVHSQVNKHEQH